MVGSTACYCSSSPYRSCWNIVAQEQTLAVWLAGIFTAAVGVSDEAVQWNTKIAQAWRSELMTI